jgi:arsenate reductase (glutaredoxin)
MSDFPITIYHNPKCGTSRNTVAMVEAAGYTPIVIEYLKAGWTAEQLEGLAKASGGTAQDLLRAKGTRAEELGLTAPDATDAQIIAAMVADPILVNRPIVVTPRGTRLCRPSERVLDLLERKPESFTKEDGEVVKI